MRDAEMLGAELYRAIIRSLREGVHPFPARGFSHKTAFSNER
jgi:hypothetical protein